MTDRRVGRRLPAPGDSRSSTGIFKTHAGSSIEIGMASVDGRAQGTTEFL